MLFPRLKKIVSEITFESWWNAWFNFVLASKEKKQIMQRETNPVLKVNGISDMVKTKREKVCPRMRPL